MRQFMQESFPCRACRHRLQNLAPEVSQFGKPGSQVGRQLCIDLPAQTLGQRWTLTGSRDSNLQIAPLHDRGKEKVAQWRVIRSVAQNMLTPGRFEDGPIDFAIICCGDDEVTPEYIRRFVIASQPADLSLHIQLLDARDSVRCDHADQRSAAQQAFDLLQANQACAYHQASLPFELQK
jgi:hypothetical protein